LSQGCHRSATLDGPPGTGSERARLADITNFERTAQSRADSSLELACQASNDDLRRPYQCKVAAWPKCHLNRESVVGFRTSKDIRADVAHGWS